jgi:hypothetical protein
MDYLDVTLATEDVEALLDLIQENVEHLNRRLARCTVNERIDTLMNQKLYWLDVHDKLVTALLGPVDADELGASPA